MARYFEQVSHLMFSGLIFFALFSPGLAISAGHTPLVPDYPVKQVAKDVYVIHGPSGRPNPANKGFMNNPGFIVTGGGVVVIDPGSSVQVGEMLLRQMRTVTDKPVVAIFNTHVHGDHWLANQAIQAIYPKVEIYGHPVMRAEVDKGAGKQWVDMMDRLTEGKTKGTTVVPPNASADNADRFVYGKHTFQIHHYGTAHTTGDIMIEVVEPGVVFLGDNVTYKRMPRMDDGTYQGNIEAISKVLGTGAKVYVPGHGPTGGELVPKSCRSYLQTVYDTVKELYEEGLADFEMKQQVLTAVQEFQDWTGFEDAVGRHISLAYLEIEQADF